MLRLFSCQTLPRLLWPIIFDVGHRPTERSVCLSKQLPHTHTHTHNPPDCAALSWALWWREKGKRAALRRNNSTVRRCQAQGAVRWVMICVHWCCCSLLCWMLNHGPLWLGVDPLCGQDPGGNGGKGWAGCNEPGLYCCAIVCCSRFFPHCVCVYNACLYVCFTMRPFSHWGISKGCCSVTSPVSRCLLLPSN